MIVGPICGPDYFHDTITNEVQLHYYFVIQTPVDWWIKPMSVIFQAVDVPRKLVSKSIPKDAQIHKSLSSHSVFFWFFESDCLKVQIAKYKALLGVLKVKLSNCFKCYHFP